MPRTDAVPVLLLGGSIAAARLRGEIAAAVDADRVLLVAEPGLDVQELAGDLHARSRRTGAFVAVACTAPEPEAVERGLFGSPDSADGTVDALDSSSAIVRANGGTLFLDDISELPAGAQARLARIARDGAVLVGGEPMQLAFRLIASVDSAADRNLPDGRIRRELARLLSATRIEVSPLRQRSEDLATLVDEMVRRTCARVGTPAKTVAAEATRVLCAMPWRGNLVELRSALERLVNAANGTAITLEDVLVQVRFDASLLPPAPVGSLRAARQQFERDYVTLVLRHHQWRMSEAARTLGMQRTNLYRKARQLGIAVTRSGARA